jgi:protein-S-isoprenylcysteine O-methyltransferase Ste14
MNQVFLLTLLFAFLAIFVESVSLILQLKDRRLSRWFGTKAFGIHMITTSTFWVITFCLIVYLQFSKHPPFHSSIILKYAGLSLLIAGVILAFWAFRLLGLKRALCLNFFEDNVPEVTGSLYRYLKNPLDYGVWMTLVGFAIFTQSVYNLVIAVEFIIIMVPHIILENKALNKQRLE